MSRTLVVQMGHVPRTTGATGTSGGGVTEQQYARLVASACQRHLHGRGDWSVRVIDADVPTASYRGDAFVAIHCDGGGASAHGAAVGHQSEPGRAAAQRFKTAYVARGWDRGLLADNHTANLHFYYGVADAIDVKNATAWIVECGFLTNAEDRARLTEPGGPDRVALAIGDALGIPTASTPTPVEPEEEDPMIAFITCLSPNQSAALLSGGQVVDITSDGEARKSAQSLINAKSAPEWHVSDATFRKLTANGGDA